MRRAIWVALVAVLVLLVPASSAFAHGGNPNYRSLIDKVTPSDPNVKFQVLNYDSYMQLLAQPGHEVVIYGYEGEPYARILKDGTVQVNERSPALYLNENRFAEVTPPPIANAKAPPKWKTFDTSGTFVWHDHRMHYMSPTVPAKVTDESKKTKIFDYEIPIRLDGKKGAVDGTLYWVGPESTSKTPFIVASILIILVGGGLVFFVRRRRRDEDDGEGGAHPEPAKEAW
jgi:hypothetical protein